MAAWQRLHLVAASLGTSIKAITRVGQDVLASPQWQNLVQSGISTQGCEFDPRLPTAMTVCAAFGGDRMMITRDIISRKLERLLERSGVQKELEKASHVHMACALWPLQVWMLAIHKLRKRGLTVSADMGWNPKVLESPRLPSLLRHLNLRS